MNEDLLLPAIVVTQDKELTRIETNTIVNYVELISEAIVEIPKKPKISLKNTNKCRISKFL